MLQLITLPNNLVASTTQAASMLFSDLSPILSIIFGVLLGAAVIGIIVSFFRR
jgi:hypothetical protein